MTWESSICGSLAGGIAAALTTPLDVVKTRLMTSSGESMGLWNCFLKVAQEEGVSGLFAGCVPRVAFIGLGGAIFFGAYEAAKGQLVAKKVFGELN